MNPYTFGDTVSLLMLDIFNKRMASFGRTLEGRHAAIRIAGLRDANRHPPPPGFDSNVAAMESLPPFGQIWIASTEAELDEWYWLHDNRKYYKPEFRGWPRSGNAVAWLINHGGVDPEFRALVSLVDYKYVTKAPAHEEYGFAVRCYPPDRKEWTECFAEYDELIEQATGYAYDITHPYLLRPLRD